MSYYGKYFREFDAALRDAEGGNMGAYECFSRFLLLFSLSLEVANAKLQNRDHGELESQYLTEAKKSRATECYAKAFAVLVGALTASPGDFLGGYVMTLGGLGKNGMGQNFTPDTVSKLLSELVLPKKPKDGPMVISEPACGSGSLIIATTEKLKKLGYGKRDFYFIANDIDDRCVKMAFIQCTLLDIPVDFYTGDTLTHKYNYRRPTLTYILNHKQTGYRQYLE